jgi:hypothetical protein
MSLVVPPYTGQNQQTQIDVPRSTQYQEQWEEGPWSMPPYAAIFPPPSEPLVPTVAFLPPPLFKTDLWSAMQVWPL